MTSVMQELGNTLSDQDVNTVASQHFEARQVSLGFLSLSERLSLPLCSSPCPRALTSDPVR